MVFFVMWIAIGIIGHIGYGFAMIGQAKEEFGKDGYEAVHEEHENDWEMIRDAGAAEGAGKIAFWIALAVTASIVSWPVSLPILWHFQMKRIRNRINR